MKILLVIIGLGVGGAERLVTSLSDRFSALGCEVLLIRLQGLSELRPLYAEVKMETLDIRHNRISLLVGVLKLARLIKDFQPDVVNGHLIHANILVRLLRIFLPMRRLVSSAHYNNEANRAKILAYRLADRLADISTRVPYSAAGYTPDFLKSLDYETGLVFDPPEIHSKEFQRKVISLIENIDDYFSSYRAKPPRFTEEKMLGRLYSEISLLVGFQEELGT